MAEVDGRRALVFVLARTTSEDVAARCRVAGQTVRQWASGDRRPNAEHRRKLESLYGIAPGAWGAADAFTPPTKNDRS